MEPWKGGSVGGTSFTFDHMQKPSNPDASWEIAVPNGVYHLNVTCGDIANVDSRYRIAAEGIPLLWDTGATYGVPDADHAFFYAQMDVTVRDGRLTISNAAGAVNNKVVSVWVGQVGPLGNG